MFSSILRLSSSTHPPIQYTHQPQRKSGGACADYYDTNMLCCLLLICTHEKEKIIDSHLIISFSHSCTKIPGKISARGKGRKHRFMFVRTHKQWEQQRAQCITAIVSSNALKQYKQQDDSQRLIQRRTAAV